MKTIDEAALEYAAGRWGNHDDQNVAVVRDMDIKAFKAGAEFVLNNQWIDLEDMKPEKDVDVLFTNGQNYFVGFYDGEGRYEPLQNVTFGVPTHWTSLPNAIDKGVNKFKHVLEGK